MTILKKGQKVSIRTVNGGRGAGALNRPKPPRIEIWAGTVIGPSVLGHDLWLVKGIGHGKHITTYTVPRHEILA